MAIAGANGPDRSGRDGALVGGGNPMFWWIWDEHGVVEIQRGHQTDRLRAPKLRLDLDDRLWWT